jgi:hypothetical protein
MVRERVARHGAGLLVQSGHRKDGGVDAACALRRPGRRRHEEVGLERGAPLQCRPVALVWARQRRWC